MIIVCAGLAPSDFVYPEEESADFSSFKFCGEYWIIFIGLICLELGFMELPLSVFFLRLCSIFGNSIFTAKAIRVSVINTFS